jgi:hypothetical protein
LEAGRLELTPVEQDFQVIVSAFSGASATDDDVRQLDESSVGQFPVLAPFRKVESGPAFRAFSVTRKTPQTSIEIRYYAGTDGLVVLTLESPGPLTPDAARQWENVLRCLNLSFT